MNEALATLLALIGARAVVPLTDYLRGRSALIDAVPLVGALTVGLALGGGAWSLAWVAELAHRGDVLLYVLSGLSAAGIGGMGRQVSSRATDAGGVGKLAQRQRVR